jgi:hypothetical protein
MRTLRVWEEQHKAKLIWSSNGRHELYDLAKDPDETENLAATQPEIVKSLTSQLDTWLSTIELAEYDQLQPEMEAAAAERLQDLGYL